MVVKADSPGAFTQTVRVLAGGGIVIAPGDTMYGLLGIAPDAEARIRAAKGREESKPFLQLLPHLSWLPRLTDMPLPDTLARYWPGPLTIVFTARAGGTVAVRVPDSAFLQELILTVGRPLYSTSVNRAGSPPLATMAAMRSELEAEVDLVYDAGDLPPGPSSTLIDITSLPWRILRQGALRLPPEVLRRA